MDHKHRVYVLSARNTKGITLFLGGEATRPRFLTNPGEAFQFDLDIEKSELVSLLDRYRNILSKYEADSVAFMIYETSLHEVDITEYDWATALQRNAVKKLSTMEIKALGVEKFEIERRMS